MSCSFAIIFVSLALFSTCLHADLISNICSKSVNPSLCNQALTSDRRSKGADARGLAQIAVVKAEAATKNSINVAKSVANAANKQIISTCIENFQSAIDNLNDCKALIQKRDGASLNTLKTRGSAALTDINTCKDEFAAKEPQQLKQADAKAYALAQLLLVIANTL